eukprot:364988-Chlamydomonas_euryale.AAC.38
MSDILIQFKPPPRPRTLWARMRTLVSGVRSDDTITTSLSAVLRRSYADVSPAEHGCGYGKQRGGGMCIKMSMQNKAGCEVVANVQCDDNRCIEGRRNSALTWMQNGKACGRTRATCATCAT